MKNKKGTIQFIFFVAILSLSMNAFSADRDSVTVIVEFNGNNLNISQKIAFSKNITALEALMRVAEVRTHLEGKYVFVDEINNVCNIKFCKAWYYLVNGEMSKVLAINCEIAKGDTVKWIYKKDVCSKKK